MTPTSVAIAVRAWVRAIRRISLGVFAMCRSSKKAKPAAAAAGQVMEPIIGCWQFTGDLLDQQNGKFVARKTPREQNSARRFVVKPSWRMSRKSGYWFFEKGMRKQRL